MPPPIGLYYPYIHFRDEAWLKTAALYWPSLARIVPLGYPTHDSLTVETLRDELDFVIDVEPGPATVETASLFRRLLADHAADLRKQLKSTSNDIRWEGVSVREAPPGVAYIHVTKMAEILRHELEDCGLLVDGDRHGRRSEWHGGRSEWVGMDARLGAVYMCVLAEHIARRNVLRPTTDQVELQAAVGGWSADRIARAILGGPASEPTTEPATGERTTQVAFLALDLVVPADAAAVPVERIVAIRKRHGAELTAFHEAVDAAAQELSELSDEVDAKILDSYIRHQVDKYFAGPMRDLEKALRGLRVPTARAVIGTKFELPAALSATKLTDAHPVMSLGVGAAVGLFNVKSDHDERRARVRAANPVGAYLLDVEKGLTPGGVVDRASRAMRRLASSVRTRRSVDR